MSASTQTAERPPLVAAADKIDGVVGLVCKTVVIATGTILLAAITVGVVSRYLIKVGGADWAEELPKQVFAWFIMAGVVLAVQKGNHVALDILLRAIPERAQKALILFTHAIVVAAYLYLGWVSLGVAEIAAFEINPILGTPGSLPYYAMLTGCLLTAVGSFTIAIRVAVLGPSAAPQPDPEDSVT